MPALFDMFFIFGMVYIFGRGLRSGSTKVDAKRIEDLERKIKILADENVQLNRKIDFLAGMYQTPPTRDGGYLNRVPRDKH